MIEADVARRQARFHPPLPSPRRGPPPHADGGRIFDFHNRIVDQDAGHQRQGDQRHHVDGETGRWLRKRRDDGQRNGGGESGRAPIAQRQKHHGAREQGLRAASSSDAHTCREIILTGVKVKRKCTPGCCASNSLAETLHYGVSRRGLRWRSWRATLNETTGWPL